jgi:hypothetical protein
MRSPKTHFAAAKQMIVASPMGGVDELGAAIQLAGCADAADSTKLGFWLRGNRHRVPGGLKLERMNERGGSVMWSLRKID